MEKSTRGQMEMIGLVIIVILITLGLLFLAKFALTQNPEKKIFVREGLAYSTMSAIMRTTVTENSCLRGRLVREYPDVKGSLLEDCARYYNFPGSLYQCRGKESCAFLNESIGEWLDGTLGIWGYKYEFKAELIRASGDEPILLIGPISNLPRGCPAKKSKDGTTQPIHTAVGLVENTLYICS